MYYRVFRYLTRPMLIAASQERKAIGLPERHDHPEYRKLPKKGKFVVRMAFPYHEGLGEGIPHVRCQVLWWEGGMWWWEDLLFPRYRSLPRFSTENSHAYRL